MARVDETGALGALRMPSGALGIWIFSAVSRPQQIIDVIPSSSASSLLCVPLLELWLCRQWTSKVAPTTTVGGAQVVAFSQTSLVEKHLSCADTHITSDRHHDRRQRVIRPCSAMRKVKTAGSDLCCAPSCNHCRGFVLGLHFQVANREPAYRCPWSSSSFKYDCVHDKYNVHMHMRITIANNLRFKCRT